VKYLVAYYSRTGNTKNLAHQIAEALPADIDEIIDQKKRKGIGGWLSAGRDATGKRDTEITVGKNPLDYDIVILGSPVWGSNLTPALRKYLATYNLKGKKVAFFATSDRDDQAEVFSQMKALCSGIEDLGSFGISSKKLKAGEYESGLKAFVEGLK
jgi:flavodoxin